MCSDDVLYINTEPFYIEVNKIIVVFIRENIEIYDHELPGNIMLI